MDLMGWPHPLVLSTPGAPPLSAHLHAAPCVGRKWACPEHVLRCLGPGSGRASVLRLQWTTPPSAPARRGDTPEMAPTAAQDWLGHFLSPHRPGASAFSIGKRSSGQEEGMPENMEAHRREGMQAAWRGPRAGICWPLVLSARWLVGRWFSLL